MSHTRLLGGGALRIYGTLAGWREPRHLRRTRELGALSDALLDVAAFLVADGGMLGWTLVGHQDPEHVPEDAHTSCVRQGELCVIHKHTPTLGGRKSMPPLIPQPADKSI